MLRFCRWQRYNTRMIDIRDDHQDWGIVGHDWAVGSLRRGLLNGRSRHAYLIAGSAGLGKMTLARSFAMALNCDQEDVARRPCRQCRACGAIDRGSDPDTIIVATDESGRIKIDTIREVMRLLALKPYAARYRVAIFDDFDQVLPQAQDALLKTLEEPPGHAVLILLAQENERILPTIRSRTQVIPLRPLPLEEVRARLIERGCEDERAELIARLSGGRMGWAFDALQDESALTFRETTLDRLREIVDGSRLQRIKFADKLSREVAGDKEQLRTILEIWQTYWRDVLLEASGSPVKPCNSDRKDEIRALALQVYATAALDALHATRRAARALDTNANVRLLLDTLFLDYPVMV